MAFNDDLFDEQLQHSVDLLRVTETIRDEVVVYLLLLRDELVKMLIDSDLMSAVRAADQLRRINKLLKDVKLTIRTAYKDSRETLKSQMLELADIQNDAANFIPNDLLKIDLFNNVLTRKDLEVIASDTLIQGSPAAEWWAQQEANFTMRFSQQIRLGMANGESMQDMVRRIRGTFTGKTRTVTVDGERKTIRIFSGGITDISTKEADALVRTAVQAISNEVLWQTYQGNEDVLRGVGIQVTLDNRTSEICRLRSGGAWDFKGNPLPESAVKIQFPGRPPYHFRCRTVIYPIVKSFSELTGIAGLLDIKAKTQASMDGQVPAELTYETWLKTKPVAFQKKVLGEGKWALWTKKKLPFSQMIDQSGNPLTLAELREKLKKRRP